MRFAQPATLVRLLVGYRMLACTSGGLQSPQPNCRSLLLKAMTK